MILSIGEILADMIGEDQNGVTAFKMYGGGAPFNVAVNAKNAGAKAGFIGRVGRDPVGKFLKGFAAGAGLDFCGIQEDETRNTTLAFVTLKGGERDFAFFRHDTADFHIDISSPVFENLGKADIVHLGSLMLSEEKGRIFARKIVEKVHQAGKLLSFDVNFRSDLYSDFEEAKNIYLPYIEKADILKFSEDELELFTGEKDIEKGAERLNKKSGLLLITMGGKGSYYQLGKVRGFVETVSVKPVDTTGAGDAFYGTALVGLDGKKLEKLSEEELKNILSQANITGAAATQHKGALASR